jgi:hypothetical protein
MGVNIKILTMLFACLIGQQVSSLETTFEKPHLYGQDIEETVNAVADYQSIRMVLF